MEDDIENPGGDPKKPKPILEIRDYEALISDKYYFLKDKLSVHSEKGTVVVFYSYRDKPVTYEGRYSNALGESAYGKMKDSEPSDLVKKYTEEVFREMEAIGNVRFFNIDNIMPADKEYLDSGGIKIISKELALDIRVSQTKFPEDCISDGVNIQPITNATREVKIDELILGGKNQELTQSEKDYIKYVTLHELMHAMGFKHPHDVEYYNKQLMSQEGDRASHTAMSYVHVDNYGNDFFPTHMQEDDIKAFVQMFGPSLNPDPALIESLYKEEIEQAQKIGYSKEAAAILLKERGALRDANVADYIIRNKDMLTIREHEIYLREVTRPKLENEYMPAIRQKLEELNSDGKITAEDLKNLALEVERLKQSLFTEDDKKLTNDPGYSGIEIYKDPKGSVYLRVGRYYNGPELSGIKLDGITLSEGDNSVKYHDGTVLYRFSPEQLTGRKFSKIDF